MRVNGYLPEHTAEFSKAAKAKIVALLASPVITPFHEKPIPRPSVHANIWLSAQDAEKANSLAGDTGMSTGEVLTAMLLRDFDSWSSSTWAVDQVDQVLTQPTEGRSLFSALKSRKRNVREEQKLIMSALDRLTNDDSSDSRVLFCEAGTGTGKTLSYLGQAIDVLKNSPDSLAVIAAPSFALLRQIKIELSAFDDQPTTLYLTGQREWVSEQALRQYLESEECSSAGHRDQILLWLSDQEPKEEDGREVDPPKWSRESLLRAVPESRYVDDFTIEHREDDDDKGYQSYLNQFEQIHSAKLVVMTHAMLATLLKRRIYAHYKSLRDSGVMDSLLENWKEIPTQDREQRLYEYIHSSMNETDDETVLDRLPNIDFLVIDEAHVFEDAVASVFSEYISLRGLIHQAKTLHKDFPSLFKGEPTQALSELEKECRNMAQTGAVDEAQDISAETELLQRLQGAIEHAINVKKNASKSSIQAAMGNLNARRLKRVLSSISLVLKTGRNGGMSAYLHWSPRKEFPRITIGRQWLNREFHYLWTVIAHHTALVSGTLYEEIPRPSCETARRALAVSVEAMMTMDPIHAKWQIDPITLHVIAHGEEPTGRTRFLPDDESGSGFIRPASKMEDETRKLMHAKWIADIEGYTRSVYESSVGGILVVGTAFADLAALATSLEKHDIHALVHRPGIDLAGLRIEFIESARRGEKPIMLAAGAAWTGFDIYDQDLPDLLTDLIVLNAPLGITQKTISRLRRAAQKSTGHYEIAAQALVLVRQVFGRLVRSPDTPHNRRIHWLDARIHEPEWRGILAPVRRFLLRYRSKTSL
jgi:CRISPR type IV-associated DEAD/DEAH-box helicase Csf4